MAEALSLNASRRPASSSMPASSMSAGSIAPADSHGEHQTLLLGSGQYGDVGGVPLCVVGAPPQPGVALYLDPLGRGQLHYGYVVGHGPDGGVVRGDAGRGQGGGLAGAPRVQREQTRQLAHPSSRSQSQASGVLSLSRAVISGMRPSRWASPSSASTEVF